MLQAFSSVARLSFGMALPYRRPSQMIYSPCRRQSRITRHPSDSFLATRHTGFGPSGASKGQGRRRLSRQGASSDTEAAETTGGSNQIDYDDQKTNSLADDMIHDATASPLSAGAAHRRRRSSAMRERSNSDATNYFLHHTYSGLSDVPERPLNLHNGSELVRTGRGGYRRVLFLDAAAVGQFHRSDSLDSSSVDSMGVNVIWQCAHVESGTVYRDVSDRLHRLANNVKGCGNWSSDGDAGESGHNAGSEN